jgi:hypothetical protein
MNWSISTSLETTFTTCDATIKSEGSKIHWNSRSCCKDPFHAAYMGRTHTKRQNMRDRLSRGADKITLNSEAVRTLI